LSVPLTMRVRPYNGRITGYGCFYFWDTWYHHNAIFTQYTFIGLLSPSYEDVRTLYYHRRGNHALGRIRCGCTQSWYNTSISCQIVGSYMVNVLTTYPRSTKDSGRVPQSSTVLKQKSRTLPADPLSQGSAYSHHSSPGWKKRGHDRGSWLHSSWCWKSAIDIEQSFGLFQLTPSSMRKAS